MPPQIAEYSAPQGLEIRPDNAAPQAFEVEARSARQFGAQAAELGRQTGAEQKEAGAAIGKELDTLAEVANQHDTTQDILNGGLHSGEVVSTALEGSRAYVAAHPLDPDAAANYYKQTVEPQLADFADSPLYRTPDSRRWAADHAASLAESMGQAAAREDAQRSGEQAVTKYRAAVFQANDTLTKDPNSLPTVLTSIAGVMAGVPGITPEARQEEISTLTKTATMRAIDLDPVNGLASKAQWHHLMSPAAQAEVQSHLQAQTLLQQHQADHDVVTRNKIEDEAFKGQLGAAYAKFIQPDGSLQTPPDYAQNAMALEKLPGYVRDPTATRQLAEFANHIKEQNASGVLDTTDQATQDGFLARVVTPSNPLTAIEVDQAKGRGLLSNADYARDRAMAEDQEKQSKLDPQTAEMVGEGFKALRDTVNPKSGVMGNIGTTGGPAKEAAVTRWAVPYYQSLVRGGIAPAAAMDKVSNDPMVAKITNSQPVASGAVPTTGTHAKPLTGQGGWFQ
jgi:hypothetical protein